MLDAAFPGVNIDPILLRVSDPMIEPGFVDPRHCLVFWGRPTTKVKDLIQRVQQELLSVAPSKAPLLSCLARLTRTRPLAYAARLSTHHRAGGHTLKES